MTTALRVLRTLLLVGALIGCASAQAVYLSGSGMGQALIYPYYTVRSTDGNAFNTYISIGNADTQAKALRVRFREGRNGREVLGFNLFLHPGAVWAAALVPGPNGARLLSRDPTCSIPAFNTLQGSAPYLDLSPALFTGNQADGLGEAEDRVREGYVEVLEMASLSGSFIEANSTDCANVRAGSIPTLFPPGGYLYGTLTLINVQSGLDFTLPAEALAQLASAAYYRAPSDPYPDFNAAEIGRVATFTYTDKLYRIEMPSALAAVEAAIARRHIVNEIALDAVTQSATDWVITMPTRRFHASGIASVFFNEAIGANGDLRIGGSFLSRSGKRVWIVDNCGFLCPPDTHERRVVAPWTTTVLGFSGATSVTAAAGTTAVLGSTNGWLIGLPDAGAGGAGDWEFVNTFSGPPNIVVNAFTTRLASGVTATERIRLYGLPVMGFMARTLRNGTITCGAGNCQGNYGGSAPHRMRREVAATP